MAFEANNRLETRKGIVKQGCTTEEMRTDAYFF